MLLISVSAAYLDMRARVSHLPHNTYTLVSGDQRIIRNAPVVIAHVDISMTQSTMRHLDLHLKNILLDQFVKTEWISERSGTTARNILIFRTNPYITLFPAG